MYEKVELAEIIELCYEEVTKKFPNGEFTYEGICEDTEKFILLEVDNNDIDEYEQVIYVKDHEEIEELKNSILKKVIKKYKNCC